MWKSLDFGFSGVDDHLRETADSRVADAFLADCLHGLDQPQKQLSCKWLYDDIGSQLFEAICATRDYYVPRAELGLLSRAIPEVAARLTEPFALVEFGSGASRKTRQFLDAARTARAYVPIDISTQELARSAAAIRADYPHVAVLPVAGDFTDKLTLPAGVPALDRVGFFPGSTLGNFDLQGAEDFLASAGSLLGPGARLLVGIDLRKDEQTLLTAYDDADGATAAFNLNILKRINRELGGDIDIRCFEHRAVWNDTLSRVEMHLLSSSAQRFRVGHRLFTMKAGETIHTENSYKFSVEQLHSLCRRAGWGIEREWLALDPAYLVILLNAFSLAPA